jgi:hypothetical protein
MQPEAQQRIEELLIGITQQKDWNSMANDLEVCNAIKELLINSFKAVLFLSPLPVRDLIQANIDKLEETGFLWSFEDLEGVFTLAYISSTSLLSTLDNKKIHDYAAPHRAIGGLDALLRLNEEKKYSENNAAEFGAAVSVQLEMLKYRLDEIDWKEGWKQKV